VSDETAHIIDEEIRSVIDENYQRTEQILKDNMDKLHNMTDALMKYETIDRGQIDDIMAGKDPREPKGWSDIDYNDKDGGSSESSDAKESTTEQSVEKNADDSDKSIGGTADQH
jgi:cell division protease FtsH